MFKQSASSSATDVSPSQARSARLELAAQLFREYHSRCFWHTRRDLEITEDRIPFVVRGLREQGGHRGYVLAGRLLEDPKPSRSSDEELSGCR